jgi:pimeloyl-ACP methyl ester carboxylesterase
VIEYLVAYARLLAGGRRPFDEVAARELVRRDVERARDFASMRNHDLLSGAESSSRPLSSIEAPSLVIHGGADPMFPPEHGEALAREIPAATLLTLDNAGHGIDRADWVAVGQAILDHTALAERAAP